MSITREKLAIMLADFVAVMAKASDVIGTPSRVFFYGIPGASNTGKTFDSTHWTECKAAILAESPAVDSTHPIKVFAFVNTDGTKVTFGTDTVASLKALGIIVIEMDTTGPQGDKGDVVPSTSILFSKTSIPASGETDLLVGNVAGMTKAITPFATTKIRITYCLDNANCDYPSTEQAVVLDPQTDRISVTMENDDSSGHVLIKVKKNSSTNIISFYDTSEPTTNAYAVIDFIG